MKRVLAFKSSLASARSNSRDSLTSHGFLENLSSFRLSYFWGADDCIEASDWIELYDSIATDYNWTTLNKLVRLGGYLRKHALAWYVETIKTYPVDRTPWSTFKELFAKRFTPPEKPSSTKSDFSSGSR